MKHKGSERAPSVCSKTDKKTSHRKNTKWLFPITGFAALVWFLIRVIPKPSRATYPCQRAAFPLASAFVVWSIGLFASAAACRKAVKLRSRGQYFLAAALVAGAITFLWVTLSNTDQKMIFAENEIEANYPIGEGKGIFPGRVAWIHDTDATSWTGSYGDTSLPYWNDDTCINQTVVANMLSEALQTVSGKDSDSLAWDAIFKDFNEEKGMGYIGYTPGEKIAIKVNFVLMYSNPADGVKPTGVRSQIDNSPQLAITLLKQLINVVGVNPDDISIGDAQMKMPQYWYDKVSAQCPGVHYMTSIGDTRTGLTPITMDTTAPFYWSDPDSSHFDGVTQQDYIPTHFAQCDYLINFPVLKSHTHAGITVGAKNHYGSLRTPTAAGYYNMHLTRVLPEETPGTGYYRATVDLLAHPKLGGKTMLTLVDGLYSGRGWDARPLRWDMAPFNGDWPNSIFLSQDRVALDSVAFDFLYNEWDGSTPEKDPFPHMSGASDYLHEAALIPNPPSGAFYDPAHDGSITESLGVHEHWNNPIDKQYSRNLDPINGTGIELVTEPTLVGDLYRDGLINHKDYAIFASAWGSMAGDANWNPACDISTPPDGVIDQYDLMVIADDWLDILIKNLIQPQAELQLVYSAPGINFEGPAWDTAGDKLYFSRRNSPFQTLCLDLQGNVTVWQDPSPETNGMWLANDGRLLACDESTKQIRSLRIDASGPGDPVVLADAADWPDFIAMPNDLCQLSNGNIYFTTPSWSGHTIAEQGVFLLEPDGTLTRLNNSIDKPNGIIASPDETKLYVAESNKKQWLVFNIAPDGTIDSGSVFFKPDNPQDPGNVPDGMTIDELGNLYFSGLGGVWVVSPEGELLEFIDTPSILNVTFGGVSGKTLYMTCNGGLYSLDMCVAGAGRKFKYDGDSPSPDPMTWAVGGEPVADGLTITMTAETATDVLTPPVTYFFECVTDESASSGWQTSPVYTTPVLDPLTEYTFKVKARDGYPFYNETVCSAAASATTGEPSADLAILGDWVAGTTHTAEPGSDRALVLIAHAENDVTLTVTSATYGGQPMTKVVESIEDNSYVASVTAFILDEEGIAAAGNGDFAVSWSTVSTPLEYGFSSVFLENVDQSDLTSMIATASTSSSYPNPIDTSPVLTNDGDLVIVAATCGNSGSYTLNNGFTEGTDQGFASSTGVTGHKFATGADETPSATHSGPNRQTILGFVVNEK